jgi:DNA-binding NtrC family response regulator
MTEAVNILVIDDDRAVREALGSVLSMEQFEVVLAANSEEAVREFIRQKVDLVLLDLNLGREENGWDIFHTLTDLCPSLPIVVISGQPERFLHESASIAAALFEKPIDLCLLVRTLRRLCQSTTASHLA